MATMANTQIQLPFQWLQEIDRRAHQKARGLPRQDVVQQIWRGIAFGVGDASLIVPLNAIREIQPCPAVLTRVPGARAWMKGLAHVRGALLIPVIDLLACITDQPIMFESDTRMLIINQAGISAGLLVDEVYGIKHLPEHTRDYDSPCSPPWVAPFAKGLFTAEGESWTVFDMHTLAETPRFLKAAL